MRLYMGLHPIHHRSVNLISMSQFGIMSKMPFLRTRGSWEDSQEKPTRQDKLYAIGFCQVRVYQLQEVQINIADSDKSDEQVQAELVALDKAIQEKLVHGEISNDLDILDYLCYEDGDEEDEHITPQFEPVDKDAVMPEADAYSHEDYDNYIASEVLLPQGDKMVLGKVISRKQDADGNPIGTASNNPIFDTRLYQVQFLMVMLRNLAQI